MVSLNSIVLCIAGIIFPMLWNKYSNALYENYGYLLGAEVILYTFIAALILTGAIDNKIYYVLDTLIFAIITKNIICGGNRLRATRYSSKETREKYDNNSNIVANMSSLIGFSISFVATIPITIAFILITIGICFDNIFYYQVYKESKYG